MKILDWLRRISRREKAPTVNPETAPTVKLKSSTPSKQPTEHFCFASSFADPADVRAFQKCKAAGYSDDYCYAIGDNGIGFTGLNCATDQRAICALPRDYWRAKFGSKEAASGARVAVTINGVTHIGILGDTMPLLANIKNGAGIDLNPGFARLFRLRPPFMVKASWHWVE